MPTATRPQATSRLADPGDGPSPLAEVQTLDALTLPGLTGTERSELAASRAFVAAFRAWCVDSSHYSRMMAAFADYQNVIRLNEHRENKQGA